jgi:RHS repeat-associated protein
MFARFTLRKSNSAASRLSSWVSNSNKLNHSKSGAKENKQSRFITRRLGKIALPKLPRGKRVLLFAVLLLSSSAAVLTSLGIQQAMRPAPSLAHVSTSESPVNVPQATGGAPLTKLREYVYAGGRLITSEEKSCVPTLSPAGAGLPQGGGTGSVNISTSSGCSWNATPSAGWIIIIGATSGVGNGTINYSVAANSGPQRNGTISINGQSFNIGQAPNPASCGYSLSKTSESLSEQASSGSVAMTTGAGCPWNASSNAGWLTITSPTSGNGSATINYSVTANNSGAQRTGMITIGGKNLTITQAPNQASCTFAISPGSQLVGVGGGSGSFNVATGAGCHWDAANANGWITITGGATGVGNGTVSFAAQANNGGSRTGAISVRGQVFTITQCGYALSLASVDLGELGGTRSIAVLMAAGCSLPWSAVSDSSWIQIVSGASGVGPGAVTIRIHGYTECDGFRQGNLTIAGRTVTVTQTGPIEPCCTQPRFCPGSGDRLQFTAPDQSAIGAGTGGLTARYFSNTTLSGQPAVERADPVVNFNWAGDGPDKSLPEDRFSARWDGKLAAPSSEAYTFYLHSEGGARLWVNNQLVIDRWQPPSKPQTRSAPVELTAGEQANIRVEYYKTGEKAAIHLLWSSASTPRQIIPQRYLHPEAATNQSSPTDTNKQTGMLLPPGSDAGPKGAQPNAASRWLAVPLGRVGLILLGLIVGAVLAVLLRIDWRRLRGRFAVAGGGAVSRLRDRIALLGVVMRLGGQRLARLWLGIVWIVARRALSLWRISGVARLKPALRRALVIALIVRLAAPLTPAEAEGLVRAAQTVWREVRAYTSAVVKPSVKMGSSARPVKVISMASQTEQVDELQVCPRRLIMFVGERYTLTPVALGGRPSPDDARPVIHGAVMNWRSLNDGVAKASSFGQVEATGVGTTSVEVQSGGVSKRIPIEVRSGTRPTGSNQEADLDTDDCSDEQASMYAPKSAAALPQQNLMGIDGVLYDWDPEPQTNSRAAHFRNAVGNPRFTAKSQSRASVPTSTQLGSYSYQFNAPVMSVGGRGASAGIAMTLNSRVWNADDGKLTFNYVGAYPGPGWTMGYGKIIRNYNATVTGDGSGVGSGNSPGDYLLVTGDGTRVHIAAKYVATANRWFHESDDGSFLQFDPRSGELRYTDGSRMIYSSVNGCLLPTAMINSNGGAITMTYRDYCEGNCVRVFRHRTALSAVRDTLGRYVTFHYYGDSDYPADAANGKPTGELAAIKAPDINGVQQEVIRVEYQPITLKYDFGSMAVDAPANNSQIQVVRRIYYPQTGRGFLFLDYSSYGMPRKISSRMRMKGAGGTITDGAEIAYTTYNYATIDPSDPYGRNQVGSLNDFPQFTRREEWWQGKTDANGAPTTATTKYDYSRTAGAATEVATVKHVDKNCEEVTTTGTDSSQLSFGKMISVELKRSTTGEVLNKQVMTYMTGPDGEVEIEKVETIDEAGQGALVGFAYGQYGRVVDQYEYGYKQGGVYQARRRTHYEYIDTPIYLTGRFLRLVSRVSIYDAKNNNDNSDDELKAKTETLYDDYTAPGWGIESYGLNPGAYPPNHDAAYDQSQMMRGNATAVTTFTRINPDESTTRRVRYDIFGNVVKAQLSCCVEKSFGFSVLTAYSQPDWVRSGPDSQTELNLRTNYEYNYFTGLVGNETNPDGLPTFYDYDGALRLKQVILPTGAVATTEFEQDGNENDLLVYISKTNYNDQGTAKIITSRQWFDGSGRVIRAGAGTGDAPDNYDMTATVYDGWGRVAKRSNPYSSDADGNPQGGAQFWTINTYDELSRVTRVTLPDTQFIQTEYRGATATSGATVIATDTVGRIRKSEVDGLGRLVKVTEQNPANGNLEWDTSYSYDALNNLTQTNQGGQLRTFTYDARSRLISEKTPEAGTTTYKYTDFDAVNTRTDDRGVITTYQYGPLNLLTGVSYNTGAGVAPTAPVSITYKSVSKGKGQIETVTDGTGSESHSYDNFGRLQSSVRVIDGISYEKRYEYNAAGQLTLMTYPSGKRVKVGRDDKGRLSAIQRVNDSGSVQETYLSGINYRADGLISSQNLGNGATESFGYSNDRLQLTSQTVTKGGNTLLNLSYGYGAGAGQMGSGSRAGNSSQVVSVSGTINGQGRNQVFTYDNVGRMTTATGWGAWARRYDYDRQGNRTAVWDAVSGGNQLQNTVIGQVGGIKTNRIASVNGTAFSYDASGNVTSDGARAFTYDAENRIVSVSGLNSESYGYDAGNRRVKKAVGGLVTHYIWEGNQVIAEYERGGSATQATGTRYYHQDRLSTRVITDSAGAVVGTTDHLPFGEEFGSSVAGEKHRFTTYERDGTGLDYAVNRFYSSLQGRFAQVDPIGMASVSLGNPQSLNLYSYVGNDPINFTDPSGLLRIIIWRQSCVDIGDGPVCESYVDQVIDIPDGPAGDIIESGGGSGGQQSPPTVAGTKDKDAINDFNNSFNEAVARLNDSDCAKLFGGLNAAQTALYGAKYSYADLGAPKYDSDTGKTKVTGAATNNALTPPSVYINKYGPFRNTTLNVITPGGIKSPTMDHGTGLRGAQFGALILLHELGHLTKVFQPDANNEQLNQSYTDQVLKACFKEIKKK